jgi:hypothetical protein
VTCVNAYTITFDANSGVVDQLTKVVAYGSTVINPTYDDLPIPMRT